MVEIIIGSDVFCSPTSSINTAPPSERVDALIFSFPVFCN